MTTFPFPVPPFLQVFHDSERGEWKLLTHDARQYLAITDEVLRDEPTRRLVADRVKDLCIRIGRAAEYAAWEAAQ